MKLHVLVFVSSFILAIALIGSPTMTALSLNHASATMDHQHDQDNPANPPSHDHSGHDGDNNSDDSSDDGFVFPGLSDRQSRRSYYGAPPVIPHRIGANDRECLNCHRTVKEYKGRRSTPTPHPELVNCQQCHVRGAGPEIFPNIVTLDTDWKPMREPRMGGKAHPYAPPTLPHRLHMRTNCSACHSKDHPDTTMSVRHSDRTDCMQCHAPDYKQASSPLSPEWHTYTSK